jgi:hypothetical protein
MIGYRYKLIQWPASFEILAVEPTIWTTWASLKDACAVGWQARRMKAIVHFALTTAPFLSTF